MVLLHVKQGDESQFLFETGVETPAEKVISDLREIYNGRLKVERICMEIEELAKHGVALPPKMLGLTDEQIEELKLADEFADICVPSGGYEEEVDPVGRRNGRRPKANMQEVLRKTVDEVKKAISKDLVASGKALVLEVVNEQINLLRGACTIVYPMNLPPYDPIRLEFEGKEDLSGTQDSLMVFSAEETELWFCGKQIFPDKKLGDYVGKNEKTKVVVKLQKKGGGPPGREPVFTEDQRKELMLIGYRKQEELKRLEEDEDDSHLNSEWADSSSLKRSFHGLANVSWKPH